MCWPPHVNINHHVKKNKGWKKLTKVSVLSIYLPIKEIPKEKKILQPKISYTFVFGWFLFFVFIVSLINTVKIQRTLFLFSRMN